MRYNGRKTFQSIGEIPLSNRENIVLSKQKYYRPRGCLKLNSLEEVFDKLQKGTDRAFIIGGEKVYMLALALVQRIHLTLVHTKAEGDAFFPTIRKSEWKEISRERYFSDEKNQFDHSFIIMERLRKTVLDFLT